ncbi:6-phospho-beta-glucosidase [Nakamurella endophytica]|uniref:6-phospho-beta-glucosidase n=1 Tax=Nakamurella endophytica TaxID=1748367 RepID=A0A917SJW2_9ACTN|nr:6-phospho-beta-glucosidase [Nakamurella endophytica]GGL85560.1 6-phospho-beta-glucosidase [Nakamurella endophytica]
MGLKIAVVGGGSTYTPELVDGVARLRHLLPVDELVLVDPAADRRELLAGVAGRILRRQGHGARVWATDDVTAAADGADAVLLQLRVGGQAARARDESWPLEYGCLGQETTGAGGLAKALRTVPVVLDIAERVRRVAPRAWIVDFTNPVGIVTRALLEHGHRAIGLCNVAIGLQRFFAGLLGVAPDRVELDHVGLNHLTWERGVRVRADGATDTDVLPTLLDRHGPAVAEHLRLPLDLVRAVGAVPSYYLRYFYRHDAVVAELTGAPSRADEVAALEAELLRLYADPALDRKPELLERRGGAYYSEAAVGLLAALLGGAPGRHVVDVRNDGALPFLPDDMVVEVPADVGPDGARPVPVAPLDPAAAGLVAHVAGYERLALDAALRGGRDRVVLALLAHPLVGQWDLAGDLADRLLAENRDLLPWR